MKLMPSVRCLEHLPGPIHRTIPARRRRGAALLLMLGLFAIAIGLAYSMARSQLTSALIQKNSSRAQSARLAAMQATSLALRSIQDGSWPGFVSGNEFTVHGSWSKDQSYAIRYTAGDSRINAAHPEYAYQPYRVTILASATVIDETDIRLRATHAIRTVVQLVPEKTPAEPPGWSDQQSYRVYQYASGIANQFHVEFPLHIDGPTRIRSPLTICGPDGGAIDSKKKYLRDLRKMRAAGLPDFRPFSQSVTLPVALTDLLTLALVTNTLRVTVNDRTLDTHASQLSDYGLNSGHISYRIYPAGPLYSAVVLPSLLQNTTIQPDPAANPLGLCVATTDLTIGANVTVRGTIVGLGNVTFASGTSDLEAAFMMPLADSTVPLRLPTLAVSGNATVVDGARVSLRGLMFVGAAFRCPVAGQSTTAFSLKGRLVTQEFQVLPRLEFNQSDKWWEDRVDEFNDVKLIEGTDYFPVWLESNYGLETAPSIKFEPPDTALNYHWKKGPDTLYEPLSTDSGGTSNGQATLRWSVVSMRDEPP
ncbi:MAG: hypothetical protein FJ295_10400 [Planctomycetes bacterium]|nr:hypothetical protein [Planctomycetota bacterium]